MKQTREDLVASGHFGRLRHYSLEFINETLAEEAAGTLVNPRYGNKRVVDKYLTNGWMHLPHPWRGGP